MAFSIDIKSLDGLQEEINTQVENVIQSNFRLFLVWTQRIEERARANCNDKLGKINLSIKLVNGRSATVNFSPSNNVRSIECIIRAIKSLSVSMDDVSRGFFGAMITNGLEPAKRKAQDKY